MDDLTKRQNFDIAALNSLASDITSVSQSMTSTSTDPFLRMGRDGIWVHGAEATEVEPKSQWAIHPLSVQHGWVCWSSNDDPSRPNTKLGEEMVRAGQPKPLLTALPNLGYEWQEQVAFTLACITGEDKGIQVKYSVSSIGGRNEVKKLLANIGQRIAAEQQKPGGLSPDTSEIVPIVMLDRSSYIHKTLKTKIYTPVFALVRWTTLNGDQPTPTPTRAAAPAPAPAPQEEDAPRRRRSRG